jgi:arsenate reductase
MQKVIFTCMHSDGCSQMAAAFFNTLAHRSRARAIAAGTQPAPAVHPEIVAVMLEAGIDLRGHEPRLLTPEIAQEGTLLVTMGCGDRIPPVTHLLREEWFLAEPHGKDVADVRRIRDDVRQRVRTLIEREGWVHAETGD